MVEKEIIKELEEKNRLLKEQIDLLNMVVSKRDNRVENIKKELYSLSIGKRLFNWKKTLDKICQ